MELLNVHYAKTHLSRLLDRVAAGEEIVLGKHGKPVAKLVPIEPVSRRPGRLKGKIKIAAGFDAPLPKKVAAAFRGGSE
ncbi:MAG: type II toxin-antitoxin system Phd/YefM family antitoxin [Acidobacteria bacterium]|nr:type II toxin-antitoxin system Phd/YefM family antitoxin [Acidobacteriota bacterium]